MKSFKIIFIYLALWFAKRVQPQVTGECPLVRYADDFVCMVQYPETAKAIETMLRQRFEKFDLTLHPQKTRIICFGRNERGNARREGRKANTFDFLGLTHFCGVSRKGNFLLGRRTSCKKFHRACKEMNAWLREVYNTTSIQVWWTLLAAKLRGHYNYYGVSGNSRMMANFGYVTRRTVMKWLNRRSQRKSFVWKQMNEYLTRYPLPNPRIVHNLYQPLPRK